MPAKPLLQMIALLLVACTPTTSRESATNPPAQAKQTGQADTPDTPPNILFILADDWGWGDLSLRDHPYLQTPNLDKLASQGTDVLHCTVASGVCSPSRTALMTGHFPARYNINQHFATVAHHQRANMPDWLDPDAPMLPRILRSAGYTTHHFGKWHLTNGAITDAPLPAAYGYDEAAVFNGPGEQATHDGLFDRTIDVINNKGTKPFFINLWLHETHTPHYPTPQMLAKYKHLPKPQQVYAAVVAEADRQIGRVLQALDDAGLADNTLVIFTSDNGPENTGNRETINDPATGPGLGTVYSVGSTGGLKGRKRSLHEGGIRVPLIVRWPGKIRAGAVDQYNTVSGVDWLPTLCQMTGTPLPENYRADGEDRSLGMLHGIPDYRNTTLYWYWPKGKNGDNWPQAAVQHGDWKLLMTLDGTRLELYRMTRDRQEQNNLAEASPKIAQGQRKMLNAWLAELPDKPDPKCFSKLRKK